MKEEQTVKIRGEFYGAGVVLMERPVLRRDTELRCQCIQCGEITWASRNDLPEWTCPSCYGGGVGWNR